MALDIVKEYYDFSEREAKQSLPLLSSEDVIQLAEELGYQVDEIKKLKKELG
jgi:ketosteroid isomerase-like protein